MKHLPYSVIETAVNALQFCITTHTRIDASRAPVVCCPPNITKSQGLKALQALTIRDFNNDVIVDAIATAVATSAFVREHHSFPLIDFNGFDYTAHRYTVQLQSLLVAITSDEKE